ncbi:MAG: hypothetical protein AAF389_21245 [Gemmatimonadota bacterium]
MNELAEVARDLAFLRDRVSERSVQPSSTIFYLWAGIVVVGCGLTDLRPASAAVIWLAITLPGGAASFWLGSRASREAGTSNPRALRRCALHWGGLIGASVLLGLVHGVGGVAAEEIGASMLFVASVSYYYAGVHIHRLFLWVAGVQGLCWLVVILAPGTPWTVLGLAIAAGLVGSGLSTSASREPSEPHLKIER